MVAVFVILLTHFSLVIAHALQQYREDKILYMIGGEEDDSYYTELEPDEDIINIGIHAGGSESVYFDNEVADVAQSMEVQVHGDVDGVLNIKTNYVANSDEIQYYND